MSDSSLFFHNLGNLHIETGSLTIVKTLDLKVLDKQISDIRKDILKFSKACYKESCGLNHQDGIVLLDQMNQLKDELKGVYAIMGSYSTRDRRALNFIGSGLKFLFGTMDHEDSKTIRDVINKLGQRQDILHSSMVDTVHLTGNLSKQWEIMRENQRSEHENFNSFRKQMEVRANTQQKFEWVTQNKEIELHFESLHLSVQFQIEKLKNAILFLKTGVIDPYLVDPEELFGVMTKENLGYSVSLEDVQVILSYSKPVAVLVSGQKVIHIVFRIPIVSEDNFNLYENLLIPKVVNDVVIILEDISKYLAISSESSKYFTLESLNCLKLSNLFICKNVLTYKTFTRKSCETSIFFQQSDSECKYRKINLTFDTYSSIGSGFVLFSTDGLSVQLNCRNFSETVVLRNSYLITPPIGCNVSSNLFDFSANIKTISRNLGNKFPAILCCSEFFKTDNTINSVKAVTFKSLHDLKSFDSTSTLTKLNTWEKFKTFDYKGNAKQHIFPIISLICIAAIGLVLIYLRNKVNSVSEINVVVEAGEPPIELREVDSKNRRNGYPMF